MSEKTQQNVMDQLRKIKALADRGLDGERIVASKMLAKKLSHLGLHIDDLEEDISEIRWFSYRNKADHDLLIQIVGKEKNVETISYKKVLKQRELGFDLTPIQYANVGFAYAFFRRLLRKEINRSIRMCILAFFSINKIISDSVRSDDQENPSTLTPEERKMLILIAMGMERTTLPIPLIGSGMSMSFAPLAKNTV